MRECSGHARAKKTAKTRFGKTARATAPLDTNTHICSNIVCHSVSTVYTLILSHLSLVYSPAFVRVLGRFSLGRVVQFTPKRCPSQRTTSCQVISSAAHHCNVSQENDLRVAYHMIHNLSCLPATCLYIHSKKSVSEVGHKFHG